MNPPSTPAVSQLHADGRLRHLLTLDGLPAATIRSLLDAAEAFKVFPPDQLQALRLRVL